VRDAHGDLDAARADAPPAVGQVPEEEHRALLDARVLEDREVGVQPAAVAKGAGDQCRADLGPRRHPLGEAAVQDGHACGLVHGPGDRARHGANRRVVIPRAQEVLGAQKLHRRAPEQADRAGQQPVEHEQPEVAAGCRARRRAPGSAREAGDGGHRDRARGGQPVGRELLAELGIGVEDGHAVVDLHRHAWLSVARRAVLTRAARGYCSSSSLPVPPRWRANQSPSCWPTSPIEEPAVWNASEMRDE
jgi:hypothetical protein